MNNTHVLIASNYLIKRAYANYLGMGGALPAMGSGLGGLPNMGTHNLGDNTSNLGRDTAPKETPAPKKAPASPANSGKTDLNAVFEQYMGTSFDPNSSKDKKKMEYLKSLSAKGTKLNAANIYDKGQGYGKF